MPQTAGQSREAMRRALALVNSTILSSREKLRWSQPLTRPYRKPTQVGGEKIPRRLREPSLRNSAK